MAHSHGLILTWNFRLVAPIAYRDASVPILSDKALVSAEADDDCNRMFGAPGGDLENLWVILGDCMSFEIGSTVKHIAGQDAFWKND